MILLHKPTATQPVLSFMLMHKFGVLMVFSFIFLVSLYDFSKTNMSGTISLDFTSMKIARNSFVFFLSKA